MIKVNINKPLKYMGKLEPCKKGEKVLCVCKDAADCLEVKTEKVEKKDESSI